MVFKIVLVTNYYIYKTIMIQLWNFYRCKEKKEEEKDALLTECENIRTKLYKF